MGVAGACLLWLLWVLLSGELLFACLATDLGKIFVLAVSSEHCDSVPALASSSHPCFVCCCVCCCARLPFTCMQDEGARARARKKYKLRSRDRAHVSHDAHMLAEHRAPA